MHRSLGKFLFLLSLAVLAVGCDSSPQSQSVSWVIGAWCTETYTFSDREAYTKELARTDKPPPKVSCMTFSSSGEIFRTSGDKGRQRIFGTFRVRGENLELSAQDKDDFRPMGERIAVDQLLVDFKRGRHLLLRKLPEGTEPESLDLSEPLPILLDANVE